MVLVVEHPAHSIDSFYLFEEGILGGAVVGAPGVLNENSRSLSIGANPRAASTPARRSPSTNGRPVEYGVNVEQVESECLVVGVDHLDGASGLLTCFINGPLNVGIQAEGLFVERGEAEDEANESVRILVNVDPWGMLGAAAIEVDDANVMFGQDNSADEFPVGLVQVDLPI
jgi:hypothetical protein